MLRPAPFPAWPRPAARRIVLMQEYFARELKGPATALSKCWTRSGQPAAPRSARSGHRPAAWGVNGLFSAAVSRRYSREKSPGNQRNWEKANNNAKKRTTEKPDTKTTAKPKQNKILIINTHREKRIHTEKNEKNKISWKKSLPTTTDYNQ